MFHLRPAQFTDDSAIKNLVRSAHLNPTGLAWRRFVVAVDAHGRLIGCGQIKPHCDGSRELASLVVLEDQRGRGVARALVEHLIGLEAGTLYLMCRASLGEFYKRFGFIAITDPADFSPYFYRIAKLASLAEFLMNNGETLLIMKR